MNMKFYGDTEHPLYFWKVIGIMLAIAGGLLIYFWRQGWFGGSDLEKIASHEVETKSNSKDV